VPFLHTSGHLLSADGKRMVVAPATYKCETQTSLYAVGQIAGDNFVRHMTGGIVCAAR